RWSWIGFANGWWACTKTRIRHHVVLPNRHRTEPRDRRDPRDRRAGRRAGLRVALVERFGCFGGNITTVGVEGFAWYRREQTVEAGGIGWEFEQRAKETGGAVAA